MTKDEYEKNTSLSVLSCKLVINSKILIPSKVYLGDCHYFLEMPCTSRKFKLVWFVIKSSGQSLSKDTELVVSRAGLAHKGVGKSS